MDMDLSEKDRLELSNFLFNHQKIEAIKAYRAIKQCDLRDAKQFIERLDQELQKTQPEKYAPKWESNNGNLILALLVIGGLIFLVKYFHLIH